MSSWIQPDVVPCSSSSIMMADAASLMESIDYLFRNYRKTDARASEESTPTFFDSLYSFATRKGAGSKSKIVLASQSEKQEQGQQSGQQDQYTAQFHGSSRQLGQWDLAGLSGVSAMHATLIPNTNKIVFLEKVEKNSHAYLKDSPTKYSWSVEYDIEEATFRSLHTKTNMFCSAGGYRPDGTIVSLGGAEAQSDIVEGWNSLRFLASCKDENSKCDWDTRDDITLTAGRWYPTVEALADGRLFIFGGSTRGASMNSKEIGVPSWELYPPLPQNPTHFPFLDETLPYNLYPTWSVIKNYPDLPGPPRNYPLSGGSVLLPLRPENNYEPEVMVCGGATDFSSRATGHDQCGRIKPLSQNPEWAMENMPQGRLMPDITLVHDGSVLIMNGANHGTAGYGRASEPVLQPVLYQPWATGSRFTAQNPSYIPRLYHSVAVPVLDGRVMYPVEYRVEMFSPGYLFSDMPRPLLRVEKTIGRTIHRPAALTVQALQAAKKSPEQGQGDGNTNENVIAFDRVFEIEVQFYRGRMTESQVVTPKSDTENTTPSRVQVNLLNGGFVTHSTHMSQRLVGLEIVGYVQQEGGLDRLKVKGPKNGALTPPGWYQMVVVESGIPSEATWIRVLQSQ
ncbi:hypothetical protein BG011_000038 [Mortierella polycephala]|uniref:Galactose oxidase n=1 Tax=Mortierella polycephala TaxID=41804 RepID=A0A9P6QJ21_9FUNG|nr:hypothetical protein BG011_000038 [Mortierella polycephala]